MSRIFVNNISPLSGSVVNVSGTLNVSNVQSASYALTASYAANGGGSGISSSYALTSSYAVVAQNVLGSITSASFATTASFATSASFARTDWSVINNRPVGLVSSSVQINTGSFSGSITSATSSSFATTASYAIIAQNVLGSITSASYALTASYAFNATGSTVSSSYAVTASFATTALTASYLTGGVDFPNGLVVTGSIVATAGFTGSLSGSIQSATSASYALTASYAMNGGGGNGVSSSYALTSSFATTAITASYISGTIRFPDGLSVTGSVIATGGFTGSLSGSITTAATASFVTPDPISIPLHLSAKSILSIPITASKQEYDTNQRVLVSTGRYTQTRISLINNQAVTGSIGLEYSTDLTNWVGLAANTHTASLRTTGISSGSWTNIVVAPNSDVVVRWVAISGSTGTGSLGSIYMQLR